MWLGLFRRRPRATRRRRCEIERLESRLMPATQLLAADVLKLLERASTATVSEDAIIAVVDRGGRILGVRVEQSVIAKDTNADGVIDIGIDTPPINGGIGNGNGIIDTAAEEAVLVYAIDGAVAKARTAAFFANGTADSRITPEVPVPLGGTATPTVGPLTSRTVRFISQTTITQREMQSNPNETADLTLRGPGFVAPVGIGGHFPPAIAHTPQVDLFGIEHTNRDSIVHPGKDSVKGTADDIDLRTFAADGPHERFNISLSATDSMGNLIVPVGQELYAPESYGFDSGRMPDAQSRGIATLPGGLPIYSGFDVVGGIGVFFPGTTDPDGAGPGRLGDATFEQNFKPGIKQTEAQRTNAPKVLEAEFVAFFAIGGGQFGGLKAKDRFVGGDFPIPFGRIDLVGITLQIIGPTPGVSGVRAVEAIGKKLGPGASSGANQIVNAALDTAIDGEDVPDGWLVLPHDSTIPGSLKEDEVRTIIEQGIASANTVRAAIRLKVTNSVRGTTSPGARTRMVFAVADEDGNVLGLYRMADSTVFSIDVAVAKARNTAYYADPTQLQTIDRVDDDHDGVPDTNFAGPNEIAFTNRTFRFLAEPRYPQGVDGSKQGAFSILNDVSSVTGDPLFRTDLLKSKNTTIAAGAVENALTVPPALSTDFKSVLGYDSFNVGQNFHRADALDAMLDKNLIANQNGIVFFPGSAPVYRAGALVGGFGVSGDGVDQDDVVTFFGVNGFRPPAAIQADQFFVRKTRLPYQKFNRNPFA